jgi:hypothetical protein
MWWM